ncbi:PucR family transcriptional regulator [Vagococcus carniphilus]|uniref:PucR family transcriptional regulator n=1 Tax=Vagococcus carniphilus TaxID=218144 RepID=UPI003B5B8502
MQLKELQAIYPQGTISHTPSEDDTLLSLPIKNQWFLLPTEKLTENEVNLLTTILPEPSMTSDLNDHPWYQYLFLQKPFPITETTYRVIQLKIKKESPNAMEWLTHLSKLFNQVEDFFFIDATTALIIEERSTIIYQKSDLEGMLLTLESEFLIQAKAFIGAFNEANQQFVPYFFEEQQIFIDYVSRKKNIFSFQDVAIDYLTKDKIADSQIMQTLKDVLNIDDELKRIVKTLWLKQGNITSTSKELYIHRNTLQYRLEKFYERTGFSLKDMSDLTLCYLLIH